jgi:hypothetical protein
LKPWQLKKEFAMAQKEEATRKAGAGRPKEPARIKAKRAEVARFLIELIEKNSGLTAAEIEDAMQVGTPGDFNGRTGRTWLRWKSGERALRPARRRQVALAAVRRGWIKPFANDAHLTELEELAFGSVRGAWDVEPKGTSSVTNHSTADWPASFFQKVKLDRDNFEKARTGAIRHLKGLHRFYLTTKPERFLPYVVTYGPGWKELEATIEKLEELEIDHYEENLRI